MAGFTTDVSEWAIVNSGVIQGLGLGFIFVPLSTITFATLAPPLRTEAAGLFNLMRNIGSSVGVSVVTALLSRYTQINHADLARHVSPYNPLMRAPYLPNLWDPARPAGLAALDAEVARQAATIAYLNDFRLMMGVMLLAMPLVLLLHKPRAKAPAALATE
jgi:DHA2 family multidrug resistance protein